MATRLVENYVGRLLSEDMDNPFGPGGRFTPPGRFGYGFDSDGRPIGPGFPPEFDPLFGPVDYTPGLDDRYRPENPDETPPEKPEPPINPNYDTTPVFQPVVRPEDLPIDGLNDPIYLPFPMQDPLDALPRPDFTDFPFPFGPRIPIRVPGLPRTTPAAPPVIG